MPGGTRKGFKFVQAGKPVATGAYPLRTREIQFVGRPPLPWLMVFDGITNMLTF